MTSPLRRKRPTTAPGRNPTPARTACSLAAVGLLLAAGLVPAQTPAPPPIAVEPPAKPAKKVKPHEPFAGDQAPIKQVQGYGPAAGADVSSGEYQYLVQPPGPDKLFTRDSEAAFMERLQQEWRDNGHKDRLIFPDEPVISTQAYAGRSWPQYNEVVEPYFVAHNRLMFQQINYERYGWDMGIIDPPLSAGMFFADVVMLPYHAFTDPFRRFDTGAGYCLPGDPTPLLLYPPDVNASGTVAETAAVLAVFAIFP